MTIDSRQPTAPPALMSAPLLILASGEGWHVQDLLRAGERLGCCLAVVRFQDLRGEVHSDRARVMAGEHNLLDSAGVLVRMMPPGSLEQVVFRMDALHRAQAAGVAVVNPPRAIEAAVDKYLALAKLAAAGLPVPETWAGESANDAINAFEHLGGDVVVKPLFGSEGRGLVRVTDRETAWRVFHAIERIGSVLYLQKFIRHSGHDIRAFVVGDRVIAAMRRHAAYGEWRTNLAQGGCAQPITLGPQSEKLALDAAHALGAEIAGIDLLEGDDRETVIVEVNAVPGWRGLAAATGLDIASQILAHCLEVARGGKR